MEGRTFRLDKLVRDGIVPDTEQSGGQVDYKNIQGPELCHALIDKLMEEGVEYCQNRNPNELAQIFGVVMELCRLEGVTLEDLIEMENARQAEMGGYSQGFYVNTVTLQEDHPWTKYYESRPDRFPEIE